MEFPRTEKLAVLKRVLDNHGAGPLPELDSNVTLERVEADGRWLLGCLGVENPTNEELRELGFTQ